MKKFIFYLITIVTLSGFIVFDLSSCVELQAQSIQAPHESDEELISTYNYGNIIYLQGKHVFTEGGDYDTVFQTRPEAVEFFEDISVTYMREAYWLIDDCEFQVQQLERAITKHKQENKKCRDERDWYKRLYNKQFERSIY